MPKSIDTLARAYSVELLSALNDQPYIEKEKLFADAVAYYRWLLADAKALDSLPLYLFEFEAHHKTLVAAMEPAVQMGCFITWFVEQRFHQLPPLTLSHNAGEKELRLIQCTRFSEPSFRLPTGDPVESYLIQWLYWHLDNLPKDDLQAEDARINLWAHNMALDLEEEEYYSLQCNGARFLFWCRKHLRTWDAFMELFARFLASSTRLDIDLANIARTDACFIAWFCQNVLDPAERKLTEPVAPQEHDA